MKRFIKSILIFLIPFSAYSLFAVTILPELIFAHNGSDTKLRIANSFQNSSSRNYEMLILGNSRVYRGINPDFLKIKSFNFSHDNDSFNQLYYKLKYILDRNKNIKYLVLGVDYFQFSVISSDRNYAYADFLGKEYLQDYNQKQIDLIGQKASYYLTFLNPKKILQLVPQKNMPYQKDNGQFIMAGQSKIDDDVSRNTKITKFQLDYFNKIRTVCVQKNIKIYYIMMPLRKNEINAYLPQEIKNFEDFMKQNTDNMNSYYFNFSEDPDFSLNDFTDITHLNENAADRLTLKLDEKIQNTLIDRY